MKNKIDRKPALVIALGSPADGAGALASSSPRAGSGGVGGADSAIGDSPRGMPNVDTVPLDALAMPDDQEQMQPPEVGDVVNYQVTGKVAAIDGNMAMVQRTSINGQEVDDADGDDGSGDNASPSDANSDPEGQSLRDDAANIGMMN